MKSFTLLAAGILITASSLTVSGCAHRTGGYHHGASSNANAPASMGAMSQGSKMERVAMCEQYAKMTPEQRRATMEAHHGKVTDEMVQRHEAMIRERCPAQ